MVVYGIVEKKEVYEKKRPYYRYFLKKKKVEIIIDLDKVFSKENEKNTDFKVREINNSISKFSIARNGEYFSTISIWDSNNRESKEHKINLTTSQGKFLYYLPFPNTEALTVNEIIKKANIEILNKPEIIDIIEVLYEKNIIEKI